MTALNRKLIIIPFIPSDHLKLNFPDKYFFDIKNIPKCIIAKILVNLE